MARVSPVPTFISASGPWVLWGDSWRGGGEDKGPHEPPGSLAGGVAGPAVLGSLRRNRNALLTGDNGRLHTTVWVSGSGWGVPGALGTQGLGQAEPRGRCPLLCSPCGPLPGSQQLG